MSRAFVKEDDGDRGVVALPDRPIGPHRNLVTRRGLRLIESKVAQYESNLARATAAADREALGRAARELRYWTARLASAEVAEPDPEADHVVFGMAVTFLREDETEATFRIVGEDEPIRVPAGSPGLRPLRRRSWAAGRATFGNFRPARSRSCPSVGRPKRSSSFGRHNVHRKPGSLVHPLAGSGRSRRSRIIVWSVRPARMGRRAMLPQGLPAPALETGGLRNLGLVPQGEQPGECEKAARQNPIDALGEWALWDPASGMGEGESDHHSDREAGDMRPDGGTLTAEAEEGEQHDPGADRRPAAEPTSPRDDLGPACVPRKDAERTEPSG